MPSKRSKSKISFKLFSANNYSRFASRFPFLKQRQIKTKLFQSWRKFKFSPETTTNKGGIQKLKCVNEIVANGAESGPPKKGEEDVAEKKPERSPINKYSVKQRNLQDDRAKRKSIGTANEEDDISPLRRASRSLKMTDNTLLTKRKQNEFIDLFEEINAETLLIEPVDISNIELLSSASGSFDRKEWLKKLTEEGTFEKSNNTVSGMFKWRADGKKKKNVRNGEKNKHESRFLESSKCEGGRNFFSMFEREDDIFL
ncbi:uncharacterized protein LOC113683636 [Pocillopora damicornis]|uniref:uncharacterized protein LOC113683636 n=1 Tax=Pocillopora damicornis TaxID=46731 RepID=UPI000F54E97F|nr:uncharacterized protein LOC113683636 [Pocillopora damicornis]